MPYRVLAPIAAILRLETGFGNGRISRGTAAKFWLHPKRFSTPSKLCASRRIEMEVTRDNFAQTLPLVKEALSACQFYSLDCEMTGLFVGEQFSAGSSTAVPGQRVPTYMHDPADRYDEMRHSAAAFLINQFGLSAFVWNPSAHRYEAKTFNFYLFPRPFESDWDPRFLCQTSSLDFLAGCGFDFQKWITKGINYMPIQLRDAKLAALHREEQRQRARPDIILTKDEDIALVSDLVESVTAWLKANTKPTQIERDGEMIEDTSLILTSTNSYQRALQYQTLRKHGFGVAPESAPGFLVQRTETEDGRPALRLQKASPAEVEAYEREQRQRRIDAIHDAAGFAAVVELMRSSGKPAIGHNLAFDLAYTLHSFVQQPLPADWEKYKQLVQDYFPGGVYDTKRIARSLVEGYSLDVGDTALGSLYDALNLQKKSNNEDARAAGTSQGQGEAKEDAADVDPLVTAMDIDTVGLSEEAADVAPHPPDVSHAVGFERYAGVQESQRYAHEAGFDAFMTGAVFVKLAGVLHHHALSTSDDSPPAQPERGDDDDEDYNSVVAALGAGHDGVHALARWCWQMNLSRSDLECVMLKGADILPDRSNVVFVSGLPPGKVQRFSDITRAVLDQANGGDGGAANASLQVRASLLWNTSSNTANASSQAGREDDGVTEALVEFESQEIAEGLGAKALRSAFPGSIVEPFAVFRSRRAQQRAEALLAMDSRRPGPVNGRKRPRVEAVPAEDANAADKRWCSIM